MLIFLLMVLIIYVLVRIIKRKLIISYYGFNSFGFSYSFKDDMFYPVKNAWQKMFGYSRYYDVLAPLVNIIIDTEVIKFRYSNKNYMICFWKGQYGIVTGSEIGVYYLPDEVVKDKALYLPVCSSDELELEFILYRKGKVILKRKDKSWWLAGFRLGLFSRLDDLAMDVGIGFKDKGMVDEFVSSFVSLGYDKDDYKVVDNKFYFRFSCPKTKKVWTRIWLIDEIRQYINRKNVSYFKKNVEKYVTKEDDKGNNVVFIDEFIPDVFKNDLVDDEV